MRRQRSIKICSILAFSAVLAFVATAHGQALSAPDKAFVGSGAFREDNHYHN
jgi:hypothetical protein